MAHLNPEGDFVPLPTVVARRSARSSLPPPEEGLRGRSPRSELLTDREASRTATPLGVLEETAPNEQSVGIYLHVPFCTKKCYFCSFNTAPFDVDVMQRYLRALWREID